MWSSMSATIACRNGGAPPECRLKESLQSRRAGAYRSIDRRRGVVRAQRREPKRELAGAVRDLEALGAGLSDGVSDAGLARAGAVGAAGPPPDRQLSRRCRGGGRLARRRILGAALAVLVGGER